MIGCGAATFLRRSKSRAALRTVVKRLAPGEPDFAASPRLEPIEVALLNDVIHARERADDAPKVRTQHGLVRLHLLSKPFFAFGSAAGIAAKAQQPE